MLAVSQDRHAAGLQEAGRRFRLFDRLSRHRCFVQGGTLPGKKCLEKIATGNDNIGVAPPND